MKSPTAYAAGGSRTARILALLILLPLVLVAVLTTYNLHSGQSLVREARLIAKTLDLTLGREQTDQRARLAVLPLVNDSGQPELDYLAFGLPAEIRARLSQTDGLLLIDSESSANASSQSLPLDAVAQLLGADHLLSGRLTTDSDQLEVAFEFHVVGAQVDGGLGDVWQHTWQGSRTELTTLSRHAAERVLDALLPGVQAAELDRPDAPSAAAMDAWLQGRYLIDRYNRDDVLQGIDWLDQAIVQAPTFGPVYSAKISAHQRMTWLDATALEQHHALTDQTIDRWLALQLEHPLTYRLRAMRAALDYRLPEALAAYQIAERLAPNQYRYDVGYMNNLCGLGYLDRCLEQALGLARANPVSASSQASVANVYFIRGEIEKMVTHAELSARFGGDLGGYFAGLAAVEEERWEEAQALLESAYAQLGMGAEWVAAGIAGLRYRTPEAIDRALAAMAATDQQTRSWQDHFYLMQYYLGDIDQAYASVEQLIDERNGTWAMYLWSDAMRAFRDDHRFVEAMNAMQATDIWRIFGPPDVCANGRHESLCDKLTF